MISTPISPSLCHRKLSPFKRSVPPPVTQFIMRNVSSGTAASPMITPTFNESQEEKESKRGVDRGNSSVAYLHTTRKRAFGG